LIVGLLILLAWVLLATTMGGESYRQKLVVHQTAGRVVDAFAHAEPFWWYLPLLPVLLLPFSLWPRMWAALFSLRRPLEAGIRFLACWLVPVLIGFSAVSGKQPYYMLPEFGGYALLMAGALSLMQEKQANTSRWLGPWPLALACAAAGAALLSLGALVRAGHVRDHFYTALLPFSVPFGVVFLLLALPLVLLRKGEVYRIAIIGLIGLVTAHGLFTLTLWPAYDFTPVAHMLAKAEAGGQPIANLESNDGQYTFLGRLTEPVTQLHSIHDVKQWATEHPEGLVITYPRRLTDVARTHAVYIQPFRGIWLAVWPVNTFIDAQARGEVDD